MSLDKIQGMFMGAFLGDALGAPHEFRVNANVLYTGVLEHQAFHVSKYQGTRKLAVGQCTDDTEMTITLLRALIRDKNYHRELVLQDYITWANSGLWMLGKNTRYLFKGIKTIKGYNNRMAKIVSYECMQSNGSMMRCSPLALLDTDEPIIEDCFLTNPNKINLECNRIYITALRLALRGTSSQQIYTMIKPLATEPEIQEVFRQIDEKIPRDIVHNKGWCLHSLWCALTVMVSFTDYGQAMRWIIHDHKGSDTDTNACIAGALLGAIFGFEALTMDPVTKSNIDILVNINISISHTIRPLYYVPSDFFKLMEHVNNAFPLN
jgi:ADP-ribosyl-[dinitrogen reductase] hydrolase